MLRRFKRYIIYKFINYIPGTSKLAEMEAKRLTQYVCENYDECFQILILEEIKSSIIDYRSNQIKNKEIDIINAQDDLKYLKYNLGKLINK
jgi:hypothetical protein